MPGQGSVGASGDLAPLAHMTRGDDRRRRRSRRRRARAGGRGAGATPGWRRWCSAPRKGWRCSTARSSRPPMRWPACSRPSACSSAALVTGALSTDAARGSDAPFDPRIHALRGHRGQIEVADALRALMAGSGDPRLASRRRRARAGSLLPALPAAGDGRGARRAAPGGGDAGDRGEWRLRQSADLRRHRRGAVGRQLPRRAGGLRRRHASRWRSARSARSPSGASPCWSIRRCPACRRS